MHQVSSYTHLIVVDLEATCDNAGAVPRHEMETIEIGAVALDAGSMDPVDEFQSFIKPVRHPYLTDFCKQLTSIQEAEVDAAERFPQVAGRLSQWLDGFPKPVFCSWGDYDRKQLQQDCRFHDIANPMPADHFNLKRLFSEQLGTQKRFGMGGALRKMGFPLVGTHHRGIDDARNIARLAPFCLGKDNGPENSAR